MQEGQIAWPLLHHLRGKGKGTEESALVYCGSVTLGV